MNPLAARVIAGSMLLPPGVLFIAGFCIVAAICDPHRKVWREALARCIKAVKKRRAAPPFALRSLIFFCAKFFCFFPAPHFLGRRKTHMSRRAAA
jgi:hypothetical protein